MKIAVSTTYTKERLWAFTYRISIAKPWRWIIMLVCTAIALTLFFSESINTGDLRGFFTFYLIFMLVYDLIMILGVLVIPALSLGKSPNLDAELQFFFGEEDFSLTAATKQTEENATVRYTALKKAIRHKNELYLMINPRQGYIVALDQLSEQDRLALRAILSNHLPQKKIIWKET